jgi:hypothetical protein
MPVGRSVAGEEEDRGQGPVDAHEAVRGATLEEWAPLPDSRRSTSHVAARFSHAPQMVAELIPFTNDTALPRVVEIACLEDWFTNYRLLIEFLFMMPPNNCASAAVLAPGWTAPEDAFTDKLKADYGWASEDVSHIGIPKPRKLTGNAAPEALKLRASWILEVASDFAAVMTPPDVHVRAARCEGSEQARAAL